MKKEAPKNYDCVKVIHTINQWTGNLGNYYTFYIVVKMIVSLSQYRTISCDQPYENIQVRYLFPITKIIDTCLFIRICLTFDVWFLQPRNFPVNSGGSRGGRKGRTPTLCWKNVVICWKVVSLFSRKIATTNSKRSINIFYAHPLKKSGSAPEMP